MKIAVDISPLHSGHKVRGVGFYLLHLKDALEKYFPENEYIFFTQGEKLPENINLVHYPYFDPFHKVIPLLNKHRVVITIHDLTPIIFPEHFPAGIRGNLTWKLQKYIAKKASAIITDSDNSRKDVLSILNVSYDKVQSVHLAAGEEFTRLNVSHDKIQSIKKKYNLPEKFILYVGDVTWNKNLPRLVSAIEKTNIPLVMVGKALVNADFDRTNPWNKDLVTVQNLIQGNSTIHRLGFVSTEDLVILYNIATLFIMPSLYEGFGLPVIEAMQSGCPVITTTEGSLKEVAGDAAYFVDAYSEESMIKGITKVFSSEKIQNELSTKGLVQAKKFSWKKTAERTIQVYKQSVS